jgi:hypothetical protein
MTFSATEVLTSRISKIGLSATSGCLADTIAGAIPDGSIEQVIQFT